jgi:transposase
VEANVSYNDEMESTMNRIPKASCTPEFRAEAVKLAHEVGGGEAARRLSISIKTLANWQRSDKA